MHPILFKFCGLTFSTYGLFVATGVLAGMFIAKKEAVRVGIDTEKIIDLYFYVLLTGIIGARLFYVFTMPDVFLSDPTEIFKIWNGGIVFYGGFITALFTALFYIKRKKMSLWKTADIAALATPAAHFFGRIGCFFAGCCYGQQCHLPWAVTFRNPDSLAPTGYPLHPTQLYASVANLLIFFFVLYYRKRKKFDGQLFWLYVLIYGIVRSTIELFRGDFRGGLLFGVFSVSQIISLIMAVIAIAMMIILRKRAGDLKTNV